MMAPQWLSRVIIVQLGCLGIRIRNNCQLPLLSSAGLLHAFIISCLWFDLIIIFILYLTLDMCLHLVIKYNWPITSHSDHLNNCLVCPDTSTSVMTTSQCPSLLSARLTCHQDISTPPLVLQCSARDASTFSSTQSSAMVIECYLPPPPPRPPCYPGDWPVNWNQPSSVVETTEGRLTEDTGHQVEGGFHWHAIDHEYQQTKHIIHIFF